MRTLLAWLSSLHGGPSFYSGCQGRRPSPAASGLLVLLAALVLAAPAGAKDRFPLRPGSSGPRVAALQWLLCGGKPNVFKKIKGTLPCRMDRGYYGDRTAKAVVAYKYRLGLPAPYFKQKTVGPRLFNVLSGKERRPADWVANAAKRVRAVVPGATPLALRIKALELSQLGVYESWGTNWGPQIMAYQRVTGAYRAAWCVSFQQWSFLHGGYGTFANRTAGVFYAVDYARNRNWLNAKPKLGAIVAFMDGQGHMGFVTKVTASGISSVEGNSANRVLQRFHPFGSRRMVYIYLPGVA